MRKGLLLSVCFVVASMSVWAQDIMGKWTTEAGKIYNPKNGKTYKCSIWLDGANLKVRGYLGVFYETQTWKRK